MSSRFFALFVAFVPLSALDAQMPPPDKKQIAEWIKDLGARQFIKRDKAQQKLWEAGQVAEEALREAAKSDDAEIKRRAADILNKFKWGIYPNTPKAVVELIESYQSADRNMKLELVQKFFDKGGPGTLALLKLIEAEEIEDVRRELYQVISREAGRAIPQLTAERKYDTLETLLDLTLTSDRDFTLPHYVAFQLLRGKLDERIAHFLKQEGKDKEKSNEILFFLYRARGDIPSARAAAEKARRNDLVLALLEERGMWQDLAAKEFPMEDRQQVERLGYRAAYLRLAGKDKEFQEAVAELKKYAEGLEADAPDRWNAAKSLFLNGKPDDALSILGKGWTAKQKADILSARMKFADALEAAAVKPGDAQSDGQLEVVRGRILHFLGKKDEAKKVFTALAARIKAGEEYSWYDELVTTEYRLGMREQAIEHCARALVANTVPQVQTRLLAAILKGQEETAQAWWAVLRKKQASEDALVTMKSLRQLLDGEIKGKELLSLVGELEAMAKEMQPLEQKRMYQAGGEVALKVGDELLARTLFDKAGTQGNSAGPFIKLGDHLAKQKKWTEAAEAYGNAHEKNRKDPLALFLKGHALVQAGQKKDGETLMEQSHWLPLGDENARLEFSRTLATRQFPAASKKERDILLRTCPPGSFHAGEAQRLNGIDALQDKDYLKAAEWHELAMLRCHRSYISFIETSAYVGVPHFIHRLEARGLVLAGKVNEAMPHITFCETAMPGNVDLTIQIVPALEKLGKKKEADERYEHMKAFKQKLIKEYPESAGLLNSFAWLSACCKRDLDQAQTLAEKAVQLEPDLPGYRDTLAEVLFQRGKKDEAILHMKKCLELEPKREYYKKQLKRFEAGDPKAEVPLEGE